MQTLGRTSSLGTAYSAATVAALITSQAGYEEWRFELLGSSGRFVRDISEFVDPGSTPVIEHDATRAVSRTLKLRVRGDLVLDPDHAVIRARYLLRAPDGGTLDWPVGIFTVPWPGRKVSTSRSWQTVDANDLTALLLDEFPASYTAPSGTDYRTAVLGIIRSLGAEWPLTLQMPDPGLFQPGLVLPQAITWDAGTTRLAAINDLLEAINYVDLWSDEAGVLRTWPIPDYDTLPASFSFDATAGASIVVGDLDDKVDPSKVANRVLVKIEDPDPSRDVVAVEYVNDSLDSPVSTVRLRRTRTLEVSDSRIPDAVNALRRAEVEAQRSAMSFSSTTVMTMPWPFSQHLDVFELVLNTTDEGPTVLDVLETGWSVTCAPGAPTKHTWSRIVSA